jgi:hypothetical protein
MAREEKTLPEIEAVRHSAHPPDRGKLKERGEPSGWSKHSADKHEWYQDGLSERRQAFKSRPRHKAQEHGGGDPPIPCQLRSYRTQVGTTEHDGKDSRDKQGI